MPGVSQSMISPQAHALLSKLEQQDSVEREQNVAREHRLRQITPDVGRFLHVLVLVAKPHSVLEIGSSGGYSTIWLAAAARHVGASVVTLEIDPAKVRRATAHLEEAGVGDSVTILQGDALDYLRDRREPVDFVFLDAEKEDYLSYLELIVPLLAPGGVLVADNLLSHADELAGFRERALSHPSLSAVIVPIGRGELLATKSG